jgi:hypothetical protein
MTLDEDAAALQAENALRAYRYRASASTVRRKAARMSCAWPTRGRPTRTIRALPCATVCCAITGSSSSSAAHRQQDSDHCGYGLNQPGSSLVPGGDANVVLYDPALRTPLDGRTLHSHARCSLWHGVALQGRVIRTISRGVTVYRDGTVTGTPSHGRFVLCAPFDRERVEEALRPTGQGV